MIVSQNRRIEFLFLSERANFTFSKCGLQVASLDYSLVTCSVLAIGLVVRFFVRILYTFSNIFLPTSRYGWMRRLVTAYHI